MLIDRKQINLISKFWTQVDKPILSCIALLWIIGFVLVITSSPFVAIRIGLSPTYFIINHIIYSIFALFVLISVSVLDLKNFTKVILIGMALSLILMLGVIVFGTEIKGAKRWLYFFGSSLQPSELAKVFFPPFLAFIISYYKNQNKDELFIYLILSLFSVFVIVLLGLQPDFGMAVLLMVVFLGILVSNGLRFLWVLVVSFLGTIIGIAAYFVFPHVTYRINTFLFEEHSYQTQKALEAIQSGKLFGTGMGQGVIKPYIPDSHTDFIFAVATEEFGFLFALVIIGLYAVIVFRGLNIALLQQSRFKSIATIGCVLLLGTQALIHIASNINLMPTKGMTLPLISYGGSSLLASAFLCGFILFLTKNDIQNIILKVK